ncbi:MAG: RnfABCDGE type electron transport complex subunit G [bacterium]
MAKKLESTFLNMVLVLTIISVIAAAALGFTFTKTDSKIKEMQAQKKTSAIKKVVPHFDNNPDSEKYSVEGIEGLEFYPAKKGGTLVGTAVETFSDNGYAGRIDVMIGFNDKLDIIDYVILNHNETPGLGARLSDNKFKSQFPGKNPKSFKLVVKKDGGEVDAITAATISSRAFLDAVNKAVEGLKKGGKQ